MNQLDPSLAALEASFRYARLGYVVLNVTDLERSARFYRDVLGLEPGLGDDGGRVFLRCSRDRQNVVLCAAAEPGLKRIAWQLESPAEFERAFAHFEHCGYAPRRTSDDECAAFGVTAAFRVRHPVLRAEFEFFDRIMQLPSPFAARLAKIVRLGHVVLRSPEHAATIGDLVRTFNFRISDVWGERTTFLRCFPNPFHHSLGIVNGSAPRLHHVNFMVTDLQDIGRALNRLRANHVPIVFGPGHHPPSDSVFLYFLDPDGLTLEYSFGMEEFGERDPRAPRWLSPDMESIDDWGGSFSPRYGAIGAIE